MTTEKTATNTARLSERVERITAHQSMFLSFLAARVEDRDWRLECCEAPAYRSYGGRKCSLAVRPPSLSARRGSFKTGLDSPYFEDQGFQSQRPNSREKDAAKPQVADANCNSCPY
jgi:hypothetical protein